MAEETKSDVVIDGKMAEFVSWVETISVLELSKLVKALEQRLGVSAAAPMMAAPAAAAPVAAVEQTEFTVVLVGVAADKKINVIKEIRAITGLGLKESKDLVEAAPKNVKEGISKEDAAKLKDVLEKAGGKVEVK